MRDKIYKITVVVFVLIAIILLSCIGYITYQKSSVSRLVKNAMVADTQTLQKHLESDYVSPIDFEVLQKANPDIYAWITIPGANIDFPVVQSEDNAYYFNRDIYGKYSSNGSIYTENYNSKDFKDRVTVIYGHNMKSGAMFRPLKEYTSKEFFDEHDKMYIYMPEKQLSYEIVGAIPFDNRHLLKNYNMQDDLDFSYFCFDILNIKDFNANYAEKPGIKLKDRLVVLSTCYFRDRNMRYLIVWKEMEEK